MNTYRQLAAQRRKERLCLVALFLLWICAEPIADGIARMVT